MRTFALLLGLATASYEIAGFERSRRQADDDQVCRKEAFLPVFAESSCTRDCAECNACVVILIQLGCDVIRELEPMRNAILDVIGRFKARIVDFFFNFGNFKPGTVASSRIVHRTSFPGFRYRWCGFRRYLIS